MLLERQYCSFAGISHGQKAHDFVAKLTARRFATAIAPGRLHQGRLLARRLPKPPRDQQADSELPHRPKQLEKAFRKFGAARFKALYRWWLLRGDPVIWAAQSPVLRDAIAYGDGRIECVELSRQYLQLTSLVGVA